MREGGYTLIELLVVLTIMAIMAVAIPGEALNGIDSLRFSGKVQTIASRLAAAHQLAIQTGKIVTVRVADLANGGLRIGLADDRPDTHFFVDGSSSGGTMMLSDFGRQRTITVDPITGQVSTSQN